MSRGLKAYQRVRVTTASPGEVIVLLYDGLTRFTTSARRALEANAFAEVGVAVTRALEILTHLRDSLDHGAAPELTTHLDRMYEAWARTLVRCQINRDLAGLDRTLDQIEQVAGAWRVAAGSAYPEGA